MTFYIYVAQKLQFFMRMTFSGAVSPGCYNDLKILQVLPYNQQEDFIFGILAFSLLELGQMSDAEEAAKKGLKINKHDCWSQHAVSCSYFGLL